MPTPDHVAAKRQEFGVAFIALLRRKARYMRADADRLEKLADKVESPPEGVSVEFGPNDVVRFVGGRDSA